jgi:DNA-binding NarL/FixJ family response regulator
MTATVLTVDDDHVFRRVLNGLLVQDAAFDLVGEADNGEEAVRAALELQPDVVLMDITMPQVNGLDATRRIKACQPGTKVVILTVHNDVNYEHAAMENGADAFIPKKRLGSDLLPTIHRLLESTAPPRETTETEIALLFIDNDAKFRRRATEHLKTRLNIAIAGCGGTVQEVIDSAATLQPEVVAVDTDDFGIEILRCLRNLFPRLGIIALTALETPAQRETALAAGADRLVVKSRFEMELVPVIESLPHFSLGFSPLKEL